MGISTNALMVSTQAREENQMGLGPKMAVLRDISQRIATSGICYNHELFSINSRA